MSDDKTMPKRKMTIDELEQLLDKEGPGSVEILPNGDIVAKSMTDDKTPDAVRLPDGISGDDWLDKLKRAEQREFAKEFEYRNTGRAIQAEFGGDLDKIRRWIQDGQAVELCALHCLSVKFQPENDGSIPRVEIYEHYADDPQWGGSTLYAAVASAKQQGE